MSGTSEKHRYLSVLICIFQNRPEMLGYPGGGDSSAIILIVS